MRAISPHRYTSGKDPLGVANCYGNLDRCSTTVNYTFTDNTKKPAGDRRAGCVGCLGGSESVVTGLG
jgi:hypothetical protein